MATTRRNGAVLVLALAVAELLGGASLSGCGENSIPEQPSYARDIKPLMTAHCTRCHGPGMPMDPEIAPVNGATASPFDFTTPGGLAPFTGTTGAKRMQDFITGVQGPGMPPPPSDRLDDWETTLLLRWCADPQP